jgi:hypothetical protein
VSLSLDAINLTEEPTNRWAYEDVELAQQSQSYGRIITVGMRFKY